MSIAILPEDLIIDNILPRLPAKFLLRFKTVCKSWLSIISSIHFAKSHLKFSSLNPHFVVLTKDDAHKLYLIPSDDDGNDHRNVAELVRLDLGRNWIFNVLNLVGCCNGLLCFHLQNYIYNDNGFLRVWNPVMRQCRTIACPDGEFFSVEYGFTYASSIDDYKIVARVNGDLLFYFSLRSSEWKMVTGIDSTTLISGSNTLFYPAKDMNRWHEDRCIVGFDVVDEKLKEIPFMNWLSRYSWVDFLAIKDCVSLLCYGGPCCDVWVLKQFGDWNSWGKMYSFNFGGMEFLNITDTGKCLVQSSDDDFSSDEFTLCDFSSTQLHVIGPSQGNPNESRVGIDLSGEICGNGVYVESLISPFFGLS